VFAVSLSFLLFLAGVVLVILGLLRRRTKPGRALLLAGGIAVVLSFVFERDAFVDGVRDSLNSADAESDG
jgi:hypothetical protein